jgi:hypothetical protein
MLKKLFPLGDTNQSIVRGKDKRSCGSEYFYLDENAVLQFPVFISTPNPDTELGVHSNAKVIQLEKFKVTEGDLTIYTGNVPSKENWLDTETTKLYYFAYEDELELWLKKINSK